MSCEPELPSGAVTSLTDNVGYDGEGVVPEQVSDPSTARLVRLPEPEPDPEHCALSLVHPPSIAPVSGLIVLEPESEQDRLLLVSSAPASDTAPSRAEIESAVKTAAVRGARPGREPALCLGTVSSPQDEYVEPATRP
jgi:hypothetical protein